MNDQKRSPRYARDDNRFRIKSGMTNMLLGSVIPAKAGIQAAIAILFLLLSSGQLEARKIGYSGDPAAKRGAIIGVDQGEIAGKADKAAGKKYSAKKQEAYLNPKQFHAIEYGAYPSFEVAFKKGFLVGYDHAYLGKKHKPKSQTRLPGHSNLGQEKAGESNLTRSKIPAYNPSDDAL